MTHTEVTSRGTKRRPGPASRRFGYSVALLVNLMMLYALNRWPGWDAVPFLTSDTERVIGLVNASIVVGLSVNVVYLLRDPLWLKALGDLLTTAVGVVVLLRIWQVFPVEFADSTVDWTMVVRILLIVAIVGSVIGIVVALVSFVRAVVTHGAR